MDIYAATAGEFSLDMDDLSVGKGIAQAPDEEPTEPGEPNASYYDNDFEDNTLTAGGASTDIQDKNGNVLVDNYGKFNVLEETGNKFLELSGAGKSVHGAISPISGAIQVSFRIRKAENAVLPDNLNLRFRSDTEDANSWFVAIQGDTLSTRGYTHTLTTEWVDVSITIDPETDVLTYQIGGAIGEEAFTYGVNCFEIYNHKTPAYSGLYIDDLKISAYEAPEEPETVNLDVTVNWEDGENIDSTRPESVFVSVYNGGTLVKREAVTAASNWQHTFTDLPKFDAEDNEIGYTVLVSTADTPAGYTVAVEGAVITLTHTPNAI